MALTTNQKTNFINDYRQAATNLMTALTAAQILKRKYDGLSLGTVLVDGDFALAGNNAGITLAEFVAAVGAVADIDSFIITGDRDDVVYKITS